MPKHGDVISGRFQEIIDPDTPAVFDGQYFNLDPAPVDQAARAKRIADALAKRAAGFRAQAKAKAQEHSGPYFVIPTKEED